MARKHFEMNSDVRKLIDKYRFQNKEFIIAN